MVLFVCSRQILAKQITTAERALVQQKPRQTVCKLPEPFWLHQTPRWLRPALFGYAMPSTSIRKFEYDPDSRILSVWFVASGRHYQFLDVPLESFVGFKSAFAKGRYFNDHIRNRFAFRLVTQPGEFVR